MDTTMETAGSRIPSIPEWFRNRNVLVTGGTGFMGKVLLSKLLLSCPDLGHVFLLVREKKGVDPQTRLQKIVQEEPFRVLREEHRDRLDKLVIVSGDTTFDGLALSQAHKERLINEVSVVFHMAANVRFDTTLRTAVTMNTKGTDNVIKMAKEMQHLDAFIHVSTAYCQCSNVELEERLYPTEVTPESVFQALETMTDCALEALTPKLLGEQPNTYALSKALSEDLVSRCGLPAGVARPSIVVPSWKEPVPGWVDNKNGPTGLMIGAGKGVIWSMLCNANYLCDVIPVDMAINAIIVLAWRVGLEQPKTPIVMNITESGENPLTWNDAIETGRKHIIANPFSGSLWYPRGAITSNWLLHNIRVLFFHILLAYILDIFCILTGNKPFMVRVQQRVNTGLRMLQYYTMKNWIFRNDAIKDTQSRLCPTDKKTFYMDTKEIIWDDYILTYILGTRKYCLKDDPSTLPRSRRICMYMYIADWCLQIMFVIALIWFVYSWFIVPEAVAATLIGDESV